MISKFGWPPLAAALLMLFGTAAHATSVSYVLDRSDVAIDGPAYLRVTISDGTGGDIDFTVEVLDPLLDLAGRRFGLDAFAFNVAPGTAAEASRITGLPEGWRSRNGRRMNSYGTFDIHLRARGTRGQDSLAFSVTGVDGDTPADYAILSTGKAPEDHQFFAAHAAGLEWPREWAQGRHWRRDRPPFDPRHPHGTAAYFGGSATAVPLPGAAWLFGAALLIIAGRARRRLPD